MSEMLYDWIKSFKAAGACDAGLRWVRENPAATVDDLCARHPDWALWAAGKCGLPLSPERLDSCAKAKPWAALIYVAARLKPERLDACAAIEPFLALRCAAALLSPARRNACCEWVNG